MSLAIVIPVYNEEKNIINLINQWKKEISKNYSKSYKFIIINDGSTDRTLSVLNKFKKNKKFKIINKKNEGHGLTCLFGYKQAILENFLFILQIDADNQCDPIYFKKIIQQSKKNDIIFGFRVSREDGFLRLVFSRILSCIIFLRSGRYLKDPNVPYRLIKTEILKKVINKIPKKINLSNCYLTYLLEKDFEIKWIKINFRKRLFGNTHHNFLSMIKMLFNLIIFFKL
jgi:glycosyltransferase involved in cell wall biosynthesis